jgi:hypothetical protein
LAAGCGEAPSPSPTPPSAATPSPTPVGTPSPTPAAPAAPDLGESGPRVLIETLGLAPLYQGFVADPKALSNLSLRLGSTVHAPTITLVVAWDERTLAGTFTLLVPDRFEASAPMADAVEADGPVDTSPLQPLIASLGAYRGELGERFDVRLMSFDIRLGMWDRHTGSRCYAPGAPQDADGVGFSACFVCVHPRTGEGELCYSGPERPGVLSGPKNLRRMLASSLRPHAPGR